MMITRSKRRKAMTAAYLSQDLIFFHILPRLPVKSLFKFSCVSKLWYNMIHDPNFIASHHNHSKSNPSLVAISGTLPETRFMYLYQGGAEGGQGEGASSLIVKVPNRCSKFLIGYINGLTCTETHFFIEICNPSTFEMLRIPYPKMRDDERFCCYGFGFDSLVNEYKILQFGDSCCRIYTVGAGLNSTQECIWRDIAVTSALPRERSDTGSAFLLLPFISTSGALFKVFPQRNLIIIFDVHYEKFHVIPGVRLCPYQFRLYTISEFRECPYAVYYRFVEDGLEFHMYAMKQQQSSNCWLIKECGNHISQFVFEQAVHIPFKPDAKAIEFVEFSGQILLLWACPKDSCIYVYNPGTKMLRKDASRSTPGCSLYYWFTFLFVRHIDNLHSLKTLVPLLPPGAPEVKYVSSREAHDKGNSTQKTKCSRPKCR